MKGPPATWDIVLVVALCASVLLSVLSVMAALGSNEWADPALTSTASVMALAALLWRRVREPHRRVAVGPLVLLVALSVAALALSGLGIAHGGTGTRIYLTLFSVNQLLAVGSALRSSHSSSTSPQQS